MNYTEKYQEFTEYLKESGKDSEFRQANAFSVIGEYDYTNCDEAFLEKVILNCKPQKSAKSVRPIVQLIIHFAKYIEDEYLEITARNIDRNKIWDKAKLDAPDCYISHKEFMEVIKEIFTHKDNEPTLFNPEYYASLFWCIYEGIYDKEFKLISNIRAKNINNQIIITFDDDGNEYRFVLPQRLVAMLVNLSDNDIWETTNTKMHGKYFDSCFKICQRKKKKKENNNKYNNSYYRFYTRRLNDVSKKYIKRKLSPQDIYVSGIMHRIILKAKEENIDWRDIFKPQSRNPRYGNIIAQELKNSNYQIPVRNFREKVKDYLYVFDED